MGEKKFDSMTVSDLAGYPARKERPIICTGSEVRGILDGSRTSLRRPVKPSWWRCLDPEDEDDRAQAIEQSPFGQAGDRLWVRESFRLRADQDRLPPSSDWWKAGAWHEADDPSPRPTGCAGGPGKLRPSTHMPRWASRITLELTGVRVERLQDITPAQAIKEGIVVEQCDHQGYEPGRGCTDCMDTGWAENPVDYFSSQWDALYGVKGLSWTDNPWVWAMEFKQVGESEAETHPPCRICGEDCFSQIEFCEELNGGQPWPTCSGCDPELREDEL